MVLVSGDISMHDAVRTAPTKSATQPGPEQDDTAQYVVAYARVVDDKDDGVHMTGVYFGGVSDTLQEAERIAQEVVNTTRGGTILPKIVPIAGCTVLDAMHQASKRFHQIEIQMLEAEEIIQRNATLRK